MNEQTKDKEQSDKIKVHNIEDKDNIDLVEFPDSSIKTLNQEAEEILSQRLDFDGEAVDTRV